MRRRFLFIGVLGLAFFAAVLMGQSASHPAKMEPASAAARLAAAERVCKLLHEEAFGVPGHLVVEHRYVWSMRWMEAQRDFDAGRGDRLSALEAHLQRMRDLEAQAEKLYKENVVSKFDLASTQFYVAEGEELVARERAK
jgi:hypothetical protein